MITHTLRWKSLSLPHTAKNSSKKNSGFADCWVIPKFFGYRVFYCSSVNLYSSYLTLCAFCFFSMSEWSSDDIALVNLFFQDDRDNFLSLALDGYKRCLVIGDKYDVKVVSFLFYV